MKLFISYSRDDSGWTYEFWRKLREDTIHEAWIDQRIVPASDWWYSILQEIENCDCFIIVMSPKSTESIYCREELQYALDLNKPILPLMLKECNIPQILKTNRTQFHDITTNPSLDRILIKVLQGLNYVELGHQRGEYPAKLAPRPLEPKPEFDPTETIQIAEDAVAKGNYSLAEGLLQRVIDSDKGILGEACKERLDEIYRERERNTEYKKIQVLAGNPTTLKTAQKAWDRFVVKFGNDYDPEGLWKLGNDNPFYSTTKEKPVLDSQSAPKSHISTGNTFEPDSPFADILEEFFGKDRKRNSTNTNGTHVNVNISLPEAFQGTTRIVTVNEKKFRLDIPAGIDQGNTLKISKTKAGLEDDIFVRVNIDPHDVFVRDKDNLYSRIRIDDETAQTGGATKVETLSGNIMLKVPPFTKSGKKFRIAGKGMPIRSKTNEFGDLFVELVYGNSLPYTISVETLGGVATPIIARGTVLPIRYIEIYSTAADSQSQIEIHLCIGEGPTITDKTSLGVYKFDGIPLAKKGIPQIEILVEIDNDYLLTVTAEEKATGKKQTYPTVNLLKVKAPPQNPTPQRPIM